jgi:hypothetical protein
MPISECDLESETTRSTRAEEEMFLSYTRGDKFPVPTIQMTNESNLSVATFKNQETGSTRVRNGKYKDCLKALRSDNAVRFSTGSTITQNHFRTWWFYSFVRMLRVFSVGNRTDRKIFSSNCKTEEPVCQKFDARNLNIISIHFDCDHNEKHSRRCLTVCCIRFTLNICVV